MTKIKINTEETNEKLAFAPPEPRYIAESYVLKVPFNDRHLSNPWHLRLYAARLIQQKIGDEVQLTGLKVKKPGPAHRSAAKLLRRPAATRLYVTVKF